MKRFFSAASLLLFAIAVGMTLALIAVSPEKHQWDFRTYYLAGQAFTAERNPYDLSVLSDLAGEPVRFPFIYPPQTLPLFGLLSRLDFRSAYFAWLAAKVVAIGLLLAVWHLFVALKRPNPFFCFFALVAFNAAMIADLDTGNVSAFEQLFLWAAFLAFVRRRWWLFAVLTAVSAFFKTTHALFLVLLLFGSSREKVSAFIVGIAAVAAPLGGSLIFSNDLFRGFLREAGALFAPLERGANNPTGFAFLEMARESANAAFGWNVTATATLALLAALSIPLVVFTGRILSRLSRSRLVDAPAMSVALSCLAFALILPRFKIYSFILLVPPAYMLFQRVGSGRFERSLLAFLVLVPGITTIPRLNAFSEYHLLLVALGLFLWTALEVLGTLGRDEVPRVS